MHVPCPCRYTILLACQLALHVHMYAYVFVYVNGETQGDCNKARGAVIGIWIFFLGRSGSDCVCTLDLLLPSEILFQRNSGFEMVPGRKNKQKDFFYTTNGQAFS